MANSWSDYYVANEADEQGHLQALCEGNHSEFSYRTKGLLGDSHKFALSLNSSGGANVIMIPSGNPDEVRFLHQGLPTSSHLGGGRYSCKRTVTSVILPSRTWTPTKP
jgi:hypothetical protein